MENNEVASSSSNGWDDDANWKLGIFYYNPKDKRLLPPKRNRYFGWTVNFANPWSIITLVLIIGALMCINHLIHLYAKK